MTEYINLRSLYPLIFFEQDSIISFFSVDVKLEPKEYDLLLSLVKNRIEKNRENKEIEEEKKSKETENNKTAETEQELETVNSETEKPEPKKIKNRKSE